MAAKLLFLPGRPFLLAFAQIKLSLHLVAIQPVSCLNERSMVISPDLMVIKLCKVTSDDQDAFSIVKPPKPIKSLECSLIAAHVTVSDFLSGLAATCMKVWSASTSLPLLCSQLVSCKSPLRGHFQTIFKKLASL